MLNKIKSLLLNLVKSRITRNLGLLDSMLQPKLTELLVTKATVAPDKAAALAQAIIAVLKDEIVELLNKI